MASLTTHVPTAPDTASTDAVASTPTAGADAASVVGVASAPTDGVASALTGGVAPSVFTRAGEDGTESGLNGAGVRRSARRDSQVRPTAQRSGRCPVEVRRFKSCSLHSVFTKLSTQEGQL